MTNLQVHASGALDENAHHFIATFMSHVATIAGYHEKHGATTARVRAYLLEAMAHGDGSSAPAWILLHRTISEALAAANHAPNTRSARVYLQSFVRENSDLAPSETFSIST